MVSYFQESKALTYFLSAVF